MTKKLKVWTAVALAVAGSAASVVQAAGEGGGEGGGTANTTIYSLNSSDPTAYKFDAQQQIKAYANLAYDSYEKAEAAARKLEKAVKALAAKPGSETLTAARTAWIEARPAYMATEAFRYYGGPIDALEPFVNEAPIKGDYIQNQIIGGKTKISEGWLKKLNQKDDPHNVSMGWHAIEYLLWQDADVLKNARTQTYLKLIAHELVEHMETLGYGWDADRKKNYRTAFMKLEQREALGRIVNGMAILAGHELADERITAAVAEANPDNEQSQFSDTSSRDFATSLAGINTIWNATMLETLVKPETASQVETLLKDAETKVAALPSPWDKVLTAPADSPAHKSAEAAATALKALAEGLKRAGNELGVLVLLPEE